MGLIPQLVERTFDKLLVIPVRWIAHLRISPNMLSTIGLIPSFIAAFLLANGWFVVAGVFILSGGLLDMLDGKLARHTNSVSRFGAMYDSTLDRFAEIAMYTGLGYYYVFQGMHLTSLLVVIAASGSVMVSYVRARAEYHGFTCNVGWMRRGERIVILGTSALLSFFPMPFDALIIGILKVLPFGWIYHYPPMPITLAVAVVAFFTQITVAHRVYHVWQQTKSQIVHQNSSQKSKPFTHEEELYK